MFCILVGLMFQRYDGFLFFLVFDIGFVYMFCSFILGQMYTAGPKTHDRFQSLKFKLILIDFRMMM